MKLENNNAEIPTCLGFITSSHGPFLPKTKNRLSEKYHGLSCPTTAWLTCVLSIIRGKRCSIFDQSQLLITSSFCTKEKLKSYLSIFEYQALNKVLNCGTGYLYQV